MDYFLLYSAGFCCVCTHPDTPPPLPHLISSHDVTYSGTPTPPLSAYALCERRLTTILYLINKQRIKHLLINSFKSFLIDVVLLEF